MGHLTWFEESLSKGITAGKELVFVACDLLGHMDVLDKLTVVGVDSDALGVIDVVDDQISIGTCNNTYVVTHSGSTALHVGKDAI